MIWLSDKQDEKAVRDRLTVGWAVPAAGPIIAEWEYLVLETDGSRVTALDATKAPVDEGMSLAQALQIAGAHRWELVGTSETGSGQVYIFKRPLMGVGQ